MAHHAVQHSINEESEDNILPPKGMGTFFVQKEKPRHVQRQGPVFVGKAANDPTQIQKISDIQESAGITKRMLETLDVRRLSGLVAQEAIKLGNLNQKKLTETDMRNLRRALYSLDPNKYRFLSPENDTSYTPSPKKTPTPTSPPPKGVTESEKISTSNQPHRKSDQKIRLPKRNTLRLVEKDIDSLLVAPPPTPEPAPEHPLFSHVRPRLQEVSARPSLDVKKIKEDTPKKEALEETPLPPQQISPEKESLVKLQAVNTLLETLYADTKEPTDFASPLKGTIKKEATPLEKVVSSGLPIIETKSWRDSLTAEERVFLKDLMTP